MLKFLLQETYKDDNGRDIPAEAVEVLAPYRHITDGFYNWSCGRCGCEHADRACGWAISGQVMKCPKCEAMNLLVRTNCSEIDVALSGKWRQPELERELDRLKGVQRLNAQNIQDIERRLTRKIHEALAAALREEQS